LKPLTDLTGTQSRRKKCPGELSAIGEMFGTVSGNYWGDISCSEGVRGTFGGISGFDCRITLIAIIIRITLVNTKTHRQPHTRTQALDALLSQPAERL